MSAFEGEKNWNKRPDTPDAEKANSKSPSRRRFLQALGAVPLTMIIGSSLTSEDARATTTLPSRLRGAESAARWHNDHDFTPEIDRAIGVLSKQKAGFTAERGHLKDFKVLLAVKHRDRQAIEVVRMSKNGENPKGYDIDWKKANGVNTNFIISQPDGYSVLRVKRVVRIGKNFKEVDYTPFTADIDTPKMRERGLQYLETVLDKAYRGLMASSVISKASPGKSLADAVPLDVSRTLSIIEHIDPARFKKEKAEALINEVLVTVAANRELSYAYAVSKAKARGLFQFIPRTYDQIRKRYPRARLLPEFVSGMNNHVNAAKASLLLFDSDLLQVPTQSRAILLRNRSELAKYLAAAYNGGAPRAAKALVHGGAWESRLLPETKVYIEKLQKVSEVFRK